METSADPCTVCGVVDTKLVDGYYYCVECGTQNTNVRETVIEDKALADGTFAQTNRKKIIQIKKDGIEMSGEWYRWHAYNFIISGLADELVALGAKPTFKVKLLWIWTKYIKKYQNKSEIMNKTSQNGNDETALPTFMMEEDSNLEVEEEMEDEGGKKSGFCHIVDGSKRDIRFLSRGLIIAMLYLALNLDESEIQLSHLLRFIQEKHLDIINLKRFIPDEISIKKIPNWLNFARSKLCTTHQIRALTMSLLRKLDLGTPKVPDLRKIVDNFLTELCLPNDMKQLVYSLMHFRKCIFLDIDNKAKKCLVRLPDYEGTVMTYVLVAIKICFGLDSHYEVKLSDVIERLNAEKQCPRSYRIGKYSEPTDRLFSFRQWCSYLQFRKVMLCKHNLRIAEKNCVDVDDCVYLEHMEERPKKNEELSDKISMEIISKLPPEENIGVIPKETFVPTLTPLTDYTDIIIDHCQDTEVKLLLAEDFKRYSLKYACENLELIDSNLENVVTGVSADRKTISDTVLRTFVVKKAKTNMVFVKNCENRNWMKTNRPTIEHVTCEPDIEVNDRESDHGYDSENTSKEKDDIVVDKSIDHSMMEDRVEDEQSNNSSSDHIEDCVNNDQSTETVRVLITEEHLDKNIFDDDFEDIDFKEECDRNIAEASFHEDDNDVNNHVPHDDILDEDFDRRSDVSDEFMPVFNPETFDRARTIRELILSACKNYKIPVPSEYRVRDLESKKRKEKIRDDNTPRAKRVKYEGTTTVKDLLSSYYNHVQSDFVTKVQQEMSLAIRNAELDNLGQNDAPPNLEVSVVERNSTIENGLDNPVSDSERNSTAGLVDEIQDQIQELDATNKTEENDKTLVMYEDLEKTLFDDDEEMKLEDLVPKGDPKFNEEKYETDQLYIKIKEKECSILSEVKNDPELDKILEKKIEECKSGTAFAAVKPQVKEIIKNVEQSDESEDEMPLSVLKEEVKLFEEMFRQEENYDKLIKKDVPQFKYWIRHYDPDFMLRSVDSHTKFDDELKENTPPSFFFVIQECASILNCSNFYLYKSMQNLEGYLIAKAKNPRINIQVKDTLEESQDFE
ncbi:TATA box-binding protein-associated factor RNA polymerase I subunit B [Anticarsia gemmatalis]|uniref:TATA box-binding protein-associated factor RNA polymerase I subunit B n=1 Tax=Anticarsia gemmatalis TaxID=129554 RepID=UPI003F7645C0